MRGEEEGGVRVRVVSRGERVLEWVHLRTGVGRGVGGGIVSTQAIYFYHLVGTKDVIGSTVLGHISSMQGTKPLKGRFTAKSQQQQDVSR